MTALFVAPVKPVAWAYVFLACTVALALSVLIIATPLGLEEQVAMSVGLFVVALVIKRFNGRYFDLALMLVSVIVSSRYIFWRLTSTLDTELSFDIALGWLLFGAELYGFAVMVLGYFQSSQPLRRLPVEFPKDLAEWPKVDVFIPTYNEPLKVVRATALAAKAMDWPKDKLNVYILDDGGRLTGWKNDAQRERASARNREFSRFAEEAGIGYITRKDGTHAKAGNLNHALAKTAGKFIAIFDCDHVPTRSFLQVTMGWMVKDPNIALVQTPHHFYSPDPLERNLNLFKNMPNEGELFYGLVQPGNDLWDATFFCGSCAVIRRKPLEEVGGVAVETVTEDAHTALKIQRRGYSTAYIGITQAAGLATESLSAHVGQRIRWARGMAQIFRTDNPLFGRGLKLPQRLCYLSAMLYFFYGLPRLIYLVAPLFFLLFGFKIFNASPTLILAYALPHLFHAILTNSKIQGRFRASIWSEVYESCLAMYILLPTTLALIAPKLGSFNVTAKGGLVESRYFSARIAWPYLVLAVLNLVGVGVAGFQLYQGTEYVDVIVINAVWATYNLVILAASIAIAWENLQLRENPRVEVSLPAMLRFAGRTYRTATRDLSLTGMSVDAPANLVIEDGERIHVSIFINDDEQPLRARIVNQHGGRIGLEFDDLSVTEESGLVQAVFGRADAWSSWSQERQPDRPVFSLLSIGFHGARGLVMLLLSPFRTRSA
ncbi:MAG: UDP-forming cellulose synthase catalytic subunit [Myxococcota bacterium]